MSHPIIINYAYHLDNIRIAKKMSVAKLCEDICDPRLYRRYRTGEKTLTHLKIIEFCQKLGISPSDFYYTASESDRYELTKINHLYVAIYNRDQETYQKELETIKKTHLISIHNQRYLELCVIRADYLWGKMTGSQAMKELSSLIDYPNCLPNEVFDFIEISALQLIEEIEVKAGIDKALNRIQEILSREEMFYLSSESRQILPSIYANVSLDLAKLKRYEESKRVAEKGIKYYLNHADLQTLTFMHYVVAYAHLMEGKRPLAETDAIKSLMSAILSDRAFDTAMFKRTLTKDFGFDPLDAIPTYKDVLYKLKTLE